MIPLAAPARSTIPPDGDIWPIADLVAIACARVERQAGYAALAAKGGARAAALQHWLQQARDCVTALARARVLRQPLAAIERPGGLLIADHIYLADPTLGVGIARGGRLSAGLCTLGFEQEAAFDWLGRDYALHHVQTELARETLFALARAADRAEQGRHPGWRLRRISVTADGPCDARRLWEPAKVQALLGLFEGDGPGVTLTGTGFFKPLHSLLRLTLMQVPNGGAAQGRFS